MLVYEVCNATDLSFVFQRSKYPLQIKKSEDQHQQMQNFFNKMKNADKDLDEKFSGTVILMSFASTSVDHQDQKIQAYYFVKHVLGMLKAGRGQMKRHHDLEPVQPAPRQEVPGEAPVVANLPAATPSSSSKESTRTVASNGWWNGWGWW